MKTVSAMEVRRSFGAILDEVRLKSETYILERAGKAVAMITPVKDNLSPSDSVQLKLRAIQELRGINAASDRGKDVDAWLAEEREGWDE